VLHGRKSFILNGGMRFFKVCTQSGGGVVASWGPFVEGPGKILEMERANKISNQN